VNSVPDTVRKNIVIILNFLSGLLTNSSNKAIFNSVEELVDLLAAADDNVASIGLETLCSLALPPCLHKQQVPEIQQHTSALHVSKSTSHKRLTSLARGWGTRGSGLGLYTCAVSDDSAFGQGVLPQQAGELNFSFFRAHPSTESKNEEDAEESSLVHIHLPSSSFAEDSEMTIDATMKSNDESDDSTGSKQKRRRVALTTKVEKTIRSTADLFFECLRQVGGAEAIPSDRLFPLLADIRLTRSFYCQATRVAAIERRLRALITILHAHPSQEVVSGYFQAQPELCVELVDLLRPTVSSGAVSAASSSVANTTHNQDNIAALANSPIVPYQVRELALQSLTALAARREGSNGALTGFARHSNILNELGVGKGQYLGLLPTLIRYSLASLGSLVCTSTVPDNKSDKSLGISPEKSVEDSMSMDIGLAFIEATSAPALPRLEQLERALVFIDSVLTLTSAIVSTPSGTSSLTECGLVPALLNTVSIDTEKVVAEIIPQSSSTLEVLRIQSLLRFVTAQAVQILEGAIVTHNNALSAFHNLKGVEVLTARLSKEVLSARDSRIKNASNDECAPMDIDNKMEIESSSISDVGSRASQRVLLFGIVTCLTVVFHQESTSSSVATPSGTAEIQKPELMEALIEILNNVDIYGGHLASLISTLLSDVMNSDPHVVRYVHESGLACSFLKMLDVGPSGEPIPPPVPELVMSIPTVLAALALTELGAKKLREKDPFPGLLKLFHHPKYAMPESRCLLNEMTSIVGTGLDEIMRHVPSLSKPICKAISNAMMQVVEFGDQVVSKELNLYPTDSLRADPSEIDHDRSCLIQYCLNFGQILEQILHNEEHCGPFVEAGGLDAILKMYPYLMPTSDRFLAHISCLSCPSLSTITHSTTEEALTLAFKCIALRYDPLKLIRKTLEATKQNMEILKASQSEMRSAFPSEKYNGEDDFDATFILDGLPCLSICDITDPSFSSKKALLAKYLRAATTIQWLAGLLSAVFQASYQRNAESGPTWNRSEREWRKEFPSTDFQEVFGCLSSYFQSATLEACRIRTEKGFEDRELKRQRGNSSGQMRYKLRIVCPEGAVVRDGIEIDNCASVGSMEMGEIVESFDRCVNSSGVLRYRTRRGWLSEQTRGHGREPIAEVLAVWKSQEVASGDEVERDVKGRIEDGIPDIRSSGANVLARMQTVYVELHSSLLRLALQSFSSLSNRHISFQQGSIGWHISTLMNMLSSGIIKGFARREICDSIRSSTESLCKINKFGIALYLGSLLSHLQTCLFEEKRDKHVVNLPLLISLANKHIETFDEASNVTNPRDVNFFDAIQLIFELSLVDFQSRGATIDVREGKEKSPRQRLDRTTASYLPPATTLLRRLISSPSAVSSSISTLLEKTKESDVLVLVGANDPVEKPSDDDKEKPNFSIQQFSRRLLCKTSDIIIKQWSDPRLVSAPPHVVHPLSTLVSETMIALEDSTKKALAAPGSGDSRENSALNIPFRNILAGFRAATSGTNTNDDFEPSEEAISRLVEMGFSRDHAWDAIDRTRSNRLEIAMEYALSNAPASAESIQRRRAERERRRRQRREQQRESAQMDSETGDDSQPDANHQSDQNAVSMEVDQAASSGDSKDETNRSREESIEMVSTRMNSWKIESSRVACNILSDRGSGLSVSESDGDGESEALTTVISSFLLELCQRYPHVRDEIAGEIFSRIKCQMEKKREGETSFWCVIPGRESSIASLCHCAVLFIRALPKVRTLMLQKGVVSSIISIIEKHFSQPSLKNVSEVKKWPIWLSSTLLILDIMAQPIVAFPATKDSVETANVGGEDFDVEFHQVKKDHEKQTNDLSALAYQLFSALSKGGQINDSSSKAKNHVGPMLHGNARGEETASKNEEDASAPLKSEMIFEAVPAYFPLIPSQSLQACTNICLNLLGDESTFIPPGVMHAILLLLMRLLRNPKTSAYCLKAGVGHRLLRLERRCRFNGHSSLIALIFRRLLEDEATLQSAMETEIRNIMIKIDGKKEGSVPGNKDAICVPRKSLVKAVTPILCRDPACFVKAMAVSVVFEKSNSGSDGRVIMLTSVQRSKNLETVSELLNLKQPYFPSGRVSTSKRSSFGKNRRLSNTSSGTRSKTPTRLSKRNQAPKRGKKEKAELKENSNDDTSRHPSYQTSSVQQITGLLLNNVIQTAIPTAGENTEMKISQSSDFDFGYETTFLWTANVLEILADLVLAMPACATAIHKFKPSRKNRTSSFASLNNALQGCPSPPRTFVSFLLHGLLSQDRWNRKSKSREDESDSNVDCDAEKIKKKAGFLRTKVVRSTARLLVALVARPGEGRRRVIVELVFALSGGQLGLTSASSLQPAKSPLHPRPSELHALQSWGELCIGFAAPKSNGNNYDSNTSLSFEVIKIMLENGMAHALLISIHRVPLYHPMASKALGALILPFEIMTRASVADSVKTIAEKENKVREDKDVAKSVKQNALKERNSHGAQRHDSFVADDHMLEDAFAAQAPRERRSTEESFDDDIIVDGDRSDMVDVDEEDVGMDVDNEGDEEASDDEMSSSSDSSDSSDVDDSDDDDNSDDEDGNSDEDSIDDEEEESILDDLEESDDVHSRGEFEDDPFNLDSRGNPMVDDDIEFDVVNDGGRDRVENLIEEGWTRIESNGLNGMVLGNRRGMGQHLSGSTTGRGRGFIDAAEAMIGTLLRTGEIRGEALAEIEGTLGIQIVPARENSGATSGRRPMSGSPFGNLLSRQGRAESNRSNIGSRELVGALPQINQRSQPDLGYSTMGRGSRWNEINPMEYVYGGPCITAGSRHYDLISPVESDTDDAYLTSSGLSDTQLFPGGPAAATHARTQNSAHPLLSDVDLPPINALVSDLQPHGVRAIRTVQPSARRLGEWTSPNFNSGGFFVSNTNGTVVRSNRMLSNPPHRSMHGSSSPFGWTDHDGLPFDATIEQFSSAFENALGETMLVASSNIQRESQTGNSQVGNNNNQGEERPPAEPSGEDAEIESNSISQEEGAVAMEEETSTEAEPVNADENEGEDEQDGDGVASPLADGLRLSPSTEPSREEERSNSNDSSSSPNPESQEGENTMNSDNQEEPGSAQETGDTGSQEEEPVDAQGPVADTGGGVPNGNGLVCPAGMDPEVFNVLPLEMQQEVVNQARETSELANQLDAGSSLDPEALAALPEDMRREVIEQEQQERRLREQAPADPSNAEEMDNASFVASLAPELRNEILLTADEAFIQSLPPNIVAEAQILRERARARTFTDQASQGNQRESASASNAVSRSSPQIQGANGRENTSSRRKQRTGKIRVEMDREEIVFVPNRGSTLMSTLVAKSDLKAFIRFMYLLSPVRPHRILQKVFQNLAMNGSLRLILSSTFLNLLNDQKNAALHALDTTNSLYIGAEDWRKKVDGLFEGSLQDFPPALLIGAAPEVLETDSLNPNILMIRRRQTSDTAASIAANLPISSRGSRHEQFLPPVVSTRILDTLLQMCKNSQRFCLDMLVKSVIIDSKSEMKSPTGFESLLDLLEKSRYSKSSANLEQLLTLLEMVVSPLSHIPKVGEEYLEVSQKDIDEAASQGKELLEVPRVKVSQERLQLLCSILRMEICKDTAFAKVNTIARRLCRVDANRGYVLTELASVARALGCDATRDLTALNIRISATINKNQELSQKTANSSTGSSSVGGTASTSVAVSTSTSELKLLRVLQTLQSLCAETSEDGSSKRNDGHVIVTEELVQLLEAMNLDNLWSELTSCLKVVQVLEGVSIEENAEKNGDDNVGDDGGDENETGGKKKLENSVAGLLTRFLPSIEAFFVANGSFKRELEKTDREDTHTMHLVGGNKLYDFVEANNILLNALVRNNSGLLEKGLKNLIHLPRCRMLLDFDVKRHWFKLQVRRLRQQANRRYGSIRLHIRRDHVFEDAYHQLVLRNADEMRGRLHITFRNEQGVDAGGLSREFFGILAKEIFNPNYALFTSTEDGCTFQPNPNSNVNPDHLSYFRFVGRIVGKAVADGYLLDSHFTRSLYKHMLGREPTHHDMEAIDPDYYKNLKTILEYNLGDLCLDLTFSVEDHSFGRNQVVDLIPNGRNIPVTEENKAKYVSLVCQNRMTTAISSQIKAYLDGFYELVSKDLIQIFTPRELELLISGLPDIDVHDLKKNTDYNGWKATDRQIEWFWNVLFSLSRNQKAAFLQFVTGSSKVPLAGFGELPGMRGVQKFSIHKTGGSAGALMSAHTCFNSLDLPVYKSEQELRDKLLYAINEGAVGFLMA
jgi:E3 ubiquitin-protein ligase HUWE1